MQGTTFIFQFPLHSLGHLRMIVLLYCQGNSSDPPIKGFNLLPHRDVLSFLQPSGNDQVASVAVVIANRNTLHG